MRVRFPALVGLVLLSGGCAGTVRPVPINPEEASSLEAARALAATDPDALTRIGLRYYAAEEWARAEDVLGASVRLRPSFAAAVYLGLSQEAQGRFDAAEASYRLASTTRMTGDQRGELDRRLGTLARVRLLAEARQAVARESALTHALPVAGSVAVLPWTFLGTSADLRPLGHGLAHLVMTDLAKLSAVQLVERERVQALLDELALARTGRVDSSSAARAGRLLRAERVVHGVIRETSRGVRLEATVVRTRDGAVIARGGVEERLDRLFAAEKSVVLDLVGQMGLTLTPAETRALSERPTQDLQSFLALSRALEREAQTLPSASAAGLARVAGPVALVEGGLQGSALWDALQFVAPGTGADLDRRGRLPLGQARLPEALGQDNPSRIALIGTIIIVIPRP